jgi:hypothetical protein
MKLLSTTVELALDLLEKNGDFIPFCKAVSEAGEKFIYQAGAGGPCTHEEGYQSIVFHAKKDLTSRDLKGVAFCQHYWVRFAANEDKVPAIKIELHYKGQPAKHWYFLYKLEGKQAEVLEYFPNPADEDLFAPTNPGPGESAQ